MSEWRPIETAPKNFTPVLVCNIDGGGMTVGKYGPLSKQWYDVFCEHNLVVTHWMPLPAPPIDNPSQPAP